MYTALPASTTSPQRRFARCTPSSEYRERYRSEAKQLTEARQKAAVRLGKEVQQQLAFLAMGKARFEVDVTPRETPSPGQPARPLTKVASGGELSRISLAIQVVAASHSTIPSLVFDEVDVGISGATAEIVGQLLRKLGENGQVMKARHHADPYGATGRARPYQRTGANAGGRNAFRPNPGPRAGNAARQPAHASLIHQAGAHFHQTGTPYPKPPLNTKRPQSASEYSLAPWGRFLRGYSL